MNTTNADNENPVSDNELDKNEPEVKVLDKASRGYRLGASFIDGLIMIAILIPIMYLTGGFDGHSEGVEPSFIYNLVMGLIGIAIFIAINFRLLTNSGQTIGKRVLGTKIVTLSGELPSVNDHLIKRYGVYLFLGQIPFVGPLLGLINVLMIFGKEKQCGHDMLAGTIVVNC